MYAAGNVSTTKLKFSGGDVWCQYDEHRVIAHDVVVPNPDIDIGDVIDEVNHRVAAKVMRLSSFVEDIHEVACRTVVSSDGCDDLSLSFEDKSTVPVGVTDEVINTCGDIPTNRSYSINIVDTCGDILANISYSINQSTVFDTDDPVDNIIIVGSTKLTEVGKSVVVSAAASATENIQERQAMIFGSYELLAEVGGSKSVVDVEVYSDDQSTVFDADDPTENMKLAEVGESFVIEYTVVGAHSCDLLQVLAVYLYLPELSRRLGSE